MTELFDKPRVHEAATVRTRIVTGMTFQAPRSSRGLRSRSALEILRCAASTPPAARAQASSLKAEGHLGCLPKHPVERQNDQIIPSNASRFI